MKENDLIASLFIVAIIILVIFTTQYNRGCETCRMFNLSNTKFRNGAYGYHYYDNNNSFFCVWDEYRSENQIVKAIEHENCHTQVLETYNHFCNNSYENVSIII